VPYHEEEAGAHTKKAAIVSVRVAPFGRRISFRTSAFWLPSHASLAFLPLLRAGAAFLAEVAFFLD
jgi:hypothetical protein